MHHGIGHYFAATLYVPASSVASYKEHEVWGKFNDIQPIVEDVYLVICQSEAGRVRIPVTKGASYALVIETENGWKINSVTYDGTIINVYTTNGVLVNSTVANSDRVCIGVTGNATYIVKVGNKTLKIAL